MTKLNFKFGNRNRFLFFFFFFTVWSGGRPAAGQGSVILRGEVVDARSNEPVIGANVLLKGGKADNSGTITDIDGLFSLSIPALPATIAVSYIGYRPQEIDLYEASDETLVILLVEDLNLLNEVVVVGYGTQKRSDFTGSLTSLPVELKARSVISPDLLLQGAIPGVQVTQSTGQPGSSSTVKVRGNTSINAGTEPLYVIDGFPVYNDDASVNAGVLSGAKVNPLSGFNASDIESIDVLKDASATAIYGSRGANGVVLITTKKSRKKESAISYDGYYGVQQVIKKYDLLNAREWGELKNDAYATSGNPPYYDANALANLGEGADWQSAIFRTSSVQSHTVSVASGKEKTQLLLSANYFKQDGIIINTGFERYSGRLNLDHNMNDKFKIVTYLNGSYTHTDIAPQSVVNNTLQMVPVVPIVDGNGDYTSNSSYGATVANPVATLNRTINETNTKRFLLNGYGEYKITRELTAKVLLGADIINNEQNYYAHSELYESSVGGDARIGYLSTNNRLNENTLSYKKDFSSIRSFEALAGFSQQESRTSIHTVGASNFLTDLTTYNDLGSGSVHVQPTSFSNKWAIRSFFGRINYGYAEKYLLTLTVRADGSSRFGENDKWGTFPSAAIAWNLNKERFLQHMDKLNSLKLRLSAGQTGNTEIAPYSSLSRLGSFSYTINNQLIYGFAPTTYADPDLTWETTTQYNLGMDLSLFSNKLQFSADAYYKKTNNLFLEVPVPFSTGLYTSNDITPVFQNCGSVENKGLEFNLKTINIQAKKIDWTTTLNFSLNRNKALDLGGTDYFIPLDPSNVTMPCQIVKVGEPLGSFYTYITDGLNEDGSQKYKDLDGNGSITQAGDRAVAGSPEPAFIAGFTNTFRYGNWDWLVFFTSSYGNEVYNRTGANIDIGSGFTGAWAELKDRWTPTHTNTAVHRAEETPAVTISDRYIEDGSYLRLKTLSIGYTLPRKWASPAKLKSARFYISGQNLLTFTKYKGYDPEVSSNGQSAINAGNDTSAYPTARSIIGGVSVSF
ncbi:MAG: TonB-dependent receptor [Tannerella sp.]|jgi:TonB-linked SusC/RagA family outer membrane protein|nr:TonB-dependent receptor [Tannerella sp.]